MVTPVLVLIHDALLNEQAPSSALSQSSARSLLSVQLQIKLKILLSPVAANIYLSPRNSGLLYRLVHIFISTFSYNNQI